MKNKRGRRRLAALLSGILALSCALSSVPVGALDGGELRSADGKVNYALGCTYTSTAPYEDSGNILYPDTGNKELTDGELALDATEHKDPRWVGFAGSPQIVEVTLDLGTDRTFNTVEYVSYVYGGAAIGLPLTEEIDYSSDGLNWTSFYNGKDRVASTEKGAEAITIPGETVTGRFVRFKFTYTQFTWLFFSEFRVLGDVGEDACEIPRFTKNLASTQSVYVDDMVNFQVEAEVSDGGTLSYQWYKDDEPVGENSSSYNISRATLEDAGVYRVVVTNTNGDATAIAVSIRCDLKVTDGGGTDPDPDDPILNPDPNNLAEGASYTSSWRANASYPDTGNKKLTDTVVASEASYRDSAWVGFNKNDASDENPLSIVVDLGEKKRFMEVATNFLSNPSAGIYCPTDVKVSISDDGSSWTALTDDTIVRPTVNMIYSYQYVADKVQSARFVKLEVTSDSSWTFLDEFRVLEYPQSSMPGDQSDNFAFEKSYTSKPAASTTYPDADSKKLTDGRTGTKDYSVDLWAGYENNNGTSEIVVDLGAPTTFEQIEMNFLNDREHGISYPESVQVEASNNGSDWNELFNDTIASADQALSIYNLKRGLDAAATARYVKVTFPTKHWVFIDEIKVMRDRTFVPEAPVVEEEMDPNNISYRKSYTLAFPANSSYPDIGNKQLTDGKRGPSTYSSREWVGFHSGGKTDAGVDCFSMIVDLGATQSFEQVKVGFLTNSGAGIYAPNGNIKIETSDDQSSWQVFAESGDNYFTRGNNGNQRYIANGSATARYVKVSVYFNDYWMFMDEVEVLAVKDERVDADKEPDNGWKNNLVRDYGYTLTGTPSQNANKAPTALTDGRFAVTGSKYDTNWLGFKDGAHVSVEFDLKNPASIYEIVFSGKENALYNQVLPQNLKILTSADGKTWTLLKEFGTATGSKLTWEGGKDPFDSPMANPGAVYTQYVRLEFDAPAGNDVVFVDEIEIIGKRGRCSDAAPVAPDKNPDGSYNLALGKPYTLDEVEVPNDFPDVGGVQLTDGILGTADTNDSAWVGYQRYVHISGDYGKTWPLKSIIVDLGEAKSITSTRLNILGMGSSSFYTQPWTMRVFASMDGENWMPMYKNWDLGLGATGIHSYGWRFKDTQGTSQDLTPNKDAPYVARYVRYDIELYCMQLVDEVEVYGYDGIVDGAEELSNLSKLENSTDNWTKPSEQNDYANHALLVYNGWYGFDSSSNTYNGNWTPERFRPYLTYIDRQGKAVDTMFDTYYFLGLTSRYGAGYHDVSGKSNPTYKKDWDWYLDKTFAEGGDLDALESAAKTAAMELNDPNFSTKAILMVPCVDSRATNWGEVNGKNLDMSKPADQTTAMNWYMQEVLNRFEAKGYEHIDFIGFTWVGENGDGGGYRQMVSDFCKANDVHSFWIPYSAAYAQLYGDKYGTENVSLQPNHYFGNYLIETGNNKTTNYHLTTSSIVKHAKMMAYAGGSVEMECGDGILRNEPAKYNQFLDYLNGCTEAGMRGPEVFQFWYNDVHAIEQFCYNTNDTVRKMYEYIYQYIKGTYTIKPYVDNVDYAEGNSYVRPAYNSAEGLVPAIGTGKIGGDGVSVNEGVSGGGSGSGGGGSVTPKPDDKPDPETPPTDDENYTWEETEDGYKLKDVDGEYVTGWAKVSGKWYYLNADGIRTTGWQKVDNNWYYLKSDGVMATGWLKLGNTWYFLNAGGVMQTGWLYNGGVWYYLYEWGGMANTSWVQVGNTWYYFRGNGAMFTGWLQQGSTWYYLKDSGAMATGWNWVGNKCYYFNASGKMAQNTTVGGYKLDASGAWVK